MPRIVVVEDNETFRALMVALLRKQFEVTEFADGDEALAAVKQSLPDIVVTDIQMPRMDGLTLTRRLRQWHTKIALPIILVSSLATVGEIMEGFEAGANDYLVKPFKPTELMAKVLLQLKARASAVPAEPVLPEKPEEVMPAALPETEIVPPPGHAARTARYGFGKYTVVGEYGRGGMGVVYHAIRRDDGADVAIKVLAPRLSKDRTMIARFLRECRILSRLRSEYAVGALDHGYEGGRYFLVMDAIEGRPLDEIIRIAEPRLKQARVAEVFLDVGLALRDLSRCGLVHRDVKPANILCPMEGRARLVDFGLAKYEDEAASLTAEGTILGTAYYMAPEVIQGGDSGIKSDLFSVGASMYEALTGRKPFTGRSRWAVLGKITVGDYPDPHKFRRDLDQDLWHIVRTLLAPNPDRRFGSIGAFVRAMRSWTANNAGPSR